MKVLFLIRALGRGGAEQQLTTLAKGLRSEGHHPEVAVFYPGGAFEADLREAGVPVHSLGKKGRWDVSLVWKVVALVRRLRPDVLHSYMATSNKLAAALRPILGGLPVVWGVRSAFMDLTRYDWLARLSYRLEPAFSGLADAIIVNSQASRNHASAAGFREDRLIVVPNGIDCNRFRPDERGREAWRRKWGAEQDSVVVGLVGRIDPMKDHSTFLRAAGEVAARVPKILFACVGDGADAYRRELQDLARAVGIERRLRWEPATGDVRGVYSALDFLVSSSYGESFPNVVAEAMACETPCVVTDVGDSAIIVGETGVVVPPSSPERLAAALDRALSLSAEARRQTGRAARARIDARFSVPALVQNTIDVFEHVLRVRGPVA